MNSFMVSFDISAIFICVFCLVSVMLHHRIERSHSKLFVAILVLLMLGSVSDTVYMVISPITQSTLDWGDAAKYTYFIFHTALAPTCFYYMASVAGKAQSYSAKMNAAFLLPAIICEILVLSNPLTGWTYTFDPLTFEYHREWLIYVLYVLGIAYLSLGVIVVCRMWNALTSNRKAGILFYTGVVITGVLVQLFVYQLRVELFAEAIAMMGMLLAIENEDDRIDVDTGVYTRHGLLLDFERYIASGNTFNVICFRFTNMEFLYHMMGEKRHANLMGQIAEWMKTLAPWYRIYKVSSSALIVVNFISDAQYTDERISSAIERFRKPWQISDAEVTIHMRVVRGTVPDDFASGEEVLLMSDTPIPMDISEQILSGRQLEFLKRRIQVERSIVRGLEDGNFEVYYQPICNSEGIVCSAEALMRLHDPELGDIPPDEFIPLAEDNGTIDRIGDFALQEVCIFLASGIPRKLGIELFHVNLSVMQCIDADLASQVCAMAERYDIEPGLLNFEITESVAASDEKAIDHMMEKLSEKGFGFAMDDYGTGYSNIHNIFSHDFDMVKIDKSILWDADKNGNGMTVLEHTVKMIRETGYKTVMEGVETEEHVRRLQELGVDYLQGFYFSKPLPKAEFIAKVEELSESSMYR